MYVNLVYLFMPTGYANEVGEAFRALVPVSLVWGSYAVATAYVTADAVDKGKKAAVVRCHLMYVLSPLIIILVAFQLLHNTIVV